MAAIKKKDVKFKVGDKVRITRKSRSGARGWSNSWMFEMNSSVGRTGIVTNIGLHHDVEVRMYTPGREYDTDYGYPDFVLKLVKAKK